jgi:hypothetical protein
MTNPRNFLMNSDYPMDKTILMLQGSVSLPANGNEVAIPHGLPFTPLILGSWSTSSSFSPAYQFGLILYAPMSLPQVYAYSDGTNIRLSSADGVARTVYYRIYGFAPSDYAGDVPIPSITTGFRMNSDYNYMKLFAEGVMTLAVGAGQNVNHNLGYKPSVLVWNKNNNGVFPLIIGDIMSGQQEASVTTTQLQIKNVGYVQQQYYYRIYLDD